MFSQEALQKILGIEEKVYTDVSEMADKLNVAFYPHSNSASQNVVNFSNKLKDSLVRLKVNIVPPDEIWEKTPLSKRVKRLLKYSFNNLIWIFRRFSNLSQGSIYLPYQTILNLTASKRIKKGIAVICIGEQDVEKLPMQYISSFKTNSIITITDFPKNINSESAFVSHFDTAMSLFAYHMTNIVLAVDDSNWMVYNFNASHPIYKLTDSSFDNHVLYSLIPKIVAPITPHRFSEFEISQKSFDISDEVHKEIVIEMQQGAALFSKTNLYPKGKKIDELAFRHPFHKLIGKLHLDNRSGMSFGFLAFQMPSKLSALVTLDTFTHLYGKTVFLDKDYYIEPKTSDLYLPIDINSKKFVLRVPEIWVMTQRSGSNKTDFNPETDLLKLGLVNGSMYMEFPVGLNVNKDYKPSFDTKVILAHAVGNAIIASVLKHLNQSNKFAFALENQGISISHWHGYFNKEYIPKDMSLYGENNPHVSCSSPQSAIYALDGKLKMFFAKIRVPVDMLNHEGDIHVEPHHGINITYPTLTGLAGYILENPQSTVLGNKYL